MHFYSTFHGAEIFETNCFKLEIFAEPFGWVTGGGFFKSSGNANAPE
jgi:hypothetical protein